MWLDHSTNMSKLSGRYLYRERQRTTRKPWSGCRAAYSHSGQLCRASSFRLQRLYLSRFTAPTGYSGYHLHNSLRVGSRIGTYYRQYPMSSLWHRLMTPSGWSGYHQRHSRHVHSREGGYFQQYPVSSLSRLPLIQGKCPGFPMRASQHEPLRRINWAHMLQCTLLHCMIQVSFSGFQARASHKGTSRLVALWCIYLHHLHQLFQYIILLILSGFQVRGNQQGVCHRADLFLRYLMSCLSHLRLLHGLKVQVFLVHGRKLAHWQVHGRRIVHYQKRGLRRMG